ncbi:unnamed protein product [Effrenium voratum]|nr:unnamed protein product [Effrenium voratum]
MELQRKRDQEELVALQEKAPAAAPGRFTVTGAALSAKAPLKDEGLCLLRRALTWEPEPPGRPFFSCLRAADTDQDGLLSRPELRHALSQWSCCPLEPAEAADLLFRLASTSNAEAADQVRWLDVLVLLDGLGGPVDETLPETPPLRWACLRAQLCAEALQQLGHLDLRGAKAFFGGFELAQEHRDAWVEAWQRHGSHRLMLLLPLAEVTLSSSEMSSWLARVKMAVQNNYQELEKSFTVWRADMLLTPEQFRMVCGDVLGLELSEEDIEDLLFLCSPQFPTPGLREVIDGQQLLQNFG